MRFAVLLMGGLLSACAARHPDDVQLSTRFRQHQAEFDRLAKIAADDQVDVSLDYVHFWHSKKSPQAQAARAAMYRNALKRLHLLQIDGGSIETRFVVSAVGLGVSGSLKEYVHTTIRVRPVVGDLDTAVPQAVCRESGSCDNYRLLAPNWYIHYSSS